MILKWWNLMSKWCRKWCVINWPKNDPKMIKNRGVKNRPKSGQKLICHGGVQNDQKSINFDLGDPDPQKRNFLKFCTFLQKLLTFRPPKSTPKRGPIENAIPHKNACTFAPMGGSKMSLFGGSEGGPLGPKNVDTTI
jgi:hypothetical protein